MRKLFIIFFTFLVTGATAQTYQNNWINYNQTYYKFTVIKEGIYRIPQSVLANAGLANVPAEHFQLWRNGEEQPIFVSNQTGIMGTADFIEFYGLRNDGKPDKKLYRKPQFQPSDYYSLVSDTSAYFLTVNASGTNKHFQTAVNNVAANTLPAEKYFMNKRSYYYHDMINPGYAIPAGGVYLYSSAYDPGEGWTSRTISPQGALSMASNDLNLYTAGPPASMTYGAAGAAFNARNVKIRFNNTFIDETPMPYFDQVKKTIPTIPLSLFTNPNTVDIYFYNTSSVNTDRMVATFWELTYPSKFNFNNETKFPFNLEQSTQGNYLEITNFNNGNTAPVLYDRTNLKRYTGDISTPGTIKFALPASSQEKREFRLVTQAPDSILKITNLIPRNFIDFSVAANQGNYVIISNPILYTSPSGRNYVEDYRQYRKSSEGGGFNAITIDIQELTDQFAYGISKHPLGIKEFIQFASQKFTPELQFVFLIGKGVTYDDARKNENSNYINQLNLVPTFGSPASDNLLSSGYGGVVTPKVPIGRLSAVHGEEIGNYLSKIKEYEGEQQSTSHTVKDKLWMKNVVQIVGGKDNFENGSFRNYMYGYKMQMEDTALGMHIETFSKTSNAAVQLVSSRRIEKLFEEGIGVLAYFGHSSATTLEYNLEDPQAYNNPSKYPLFIVSGCTAGNNFVFDTLRMISGRSTISESFVLSKNRGSIGFMASTHYGIPKYLNDYNTTMYNYMSKGNYGSPLGLVIKNTIKSLGGDNPDLYFDVRADAEEMALHGDPALKVHSQAKPDYVIEPSLVKIDPGFISVSNQKFTVFAKTYNLGKAVSDSITWEVKRTHPDGKVTILFRQRMASPYYADSILLSVPIVSSNDKGLNKITVTIDADNNVDEMSESNNSITKEFYIFEDEATPQYPQNFAIINKDDEKMYASTANPLSPSKDYVFQLDTTRLFNSPVKISKQMRKSGGIIEFDPGIKYTDSTVYYWRVMVKSDTTTEENARWNYSSFIYLKNSSPGINQSGYYQHLYSDTQNIRMNENRKWEFGKMTNLIQSKGGVAATAWTQSSDYQTNVNGSLIVKSICGDSGIIFNIINPITLKPMYNTMVQGRFGSQPVCFENSLANFQFNLFSQTQRIAAYRFLKDSVPDGYVVVAKNATRSLQSSSTYAADWQNDTTVLGSGKSLYHILLENGFTEIDSFYRPRGFIFMYQKNNDDFVPTFVLSQGISDKIELTHPIEAPDSLGYIRSPLFGPVKSWTELHWNGYETDTSLTNNPEVSVIGIKNDGSESVLSTADKTQKDVDLSFVDAKEYPYLRLEMRNADSISFEPYQLTYWRLNYIPAPEGGIEPSIYFKTKDTVMQGEPLEFGIAFKNISNQNFDSVKVRVNVIDGNNVTHVIEVPMQKPLVAGDTIKLQLNIDTKTFTGANTLYVEFNPDNHQPEQHHFNNFIFQNFYVKPDFFNPLLDVTFDGIHILNRDIVSPKPHIVIKLKDENRFMKMSDTSLLKVQLKYSGGPNSPDILRTIPFDNDTLRFTPPSGDENTATIDYTPHFTGEDSEYELIVSGKDVAGNKSGSVDYHVTFRVIGKSMISELLNYPNPFTTSTAFVFTLTGSEIPQNFRIQILTVTGKVVREITKEELGPIRIGRNITEFKWDGTDMYGQPLANGVYLYRVLTNLNGKSLEKFNDKDFQIPNSSGFFKGGYGKMYLMR